MKKEIIKVYMSGSELERGDLVYLQDMTDVKGKQLGRITALHEGQADIRPCYKWEQWMNEAFMWVHNIWDRFILNIYKAEDKVRAIYFRGRHTSKINSTEAQDR